MATIRMGSRQRKWILLLHIVAGGIWLGLGIVVAGAGAHRQGCCRSADGRVLLPGPGVADDLADDGGRAGLAGHRLLLGIGTKYGLLRYWWLAVKLATNLVLNTLVVVPLRPGLHVAGDYGRQIADGLPTDFDSSSLMSPPIMAASAPGLRQSDASVRAVGTD